MSEDMQLAITSYKETLWLPYSLFHYAIVFAQLVCSIYLSTKKYLETYALSFSIHTLEFMDLSLFSFEALHHHVSGMNNLFFGESVQYMSVQLQDFIIDMFF